MIYVYGKIIGATLGLLIGGSFGLGSAFGLLLGLMAGHLFDKGLALEQTFSRNEEVNETNRFFFSTLFMMMGFMAKADGRVSEREIALARKVMNDLHLNEAQRLSAIQHFNQGKTPYFDWQKALKDFVKYCGDQPQLVQLFIEIQLQNAFVEGAPTRLKKQVIHQICYELNIPVSIFAQMESKFKAEQVFQEPDYTPEDELSRAYKLLGISKKATDQQVKKAYRQAISQHHPDKLLARGLSEQSIKAATEKTQKIQKAYELICQTRGM